MQFLSLTDLYHCVDALEHRDFLRESTRYIKINLVLKNLIKRAKISVIHKWRIMCNPNAQ
jgi:hypothetical protein